MRKQKKEYPEEIRQRLIGLLNEGPLLPGRIKKQRCCPNWDYLAKELFKDLESIPKASSAVEEIAII